MNSLRSVRERGERVNTDTEYLAFDPFFGDRDVRIECRKVSLVTVRKEQPCAASWLLDGYHPIAPGLRAKKETAKVDGQFGSCYCCLPCLDRLIEMNKPDFDFRTP